MDYVSFPRKLLIERDHDWNIVSNTAVAGVGSYGSTSIRSDGGGLWSASINNIEFRDKTYTLLWRAIRQDANGGVNPIIVPRNDITWAPLPVPEYGSIFFSDGTGFSDGTCFYQNVIQVNANGDTALRATTMNLDLVYCGPLQGGDSFSIKHPTWGWRLYEIANVIYSDSTHATISFNPPLREFVPDETVLEF